jgi:HSP20 family protein
MLVQVRRYPVYNALWNEISNFENEIDSVFENFFNADVAPALRGERRYAPAIDVVENENETLLVAELPGVSKDDIKLSVENNLLTISSSRKTNALPEKATWVRNEIRTGDFVRTLQLPEGIAAENISAEMNNGLLKITLPKAEEVKPREIRIN